MFVCLRMQCPSVQCGCGNRNGLWCVPQHLVLEDWEVPQWDNSWEPRSSWIPFAKLTMEIHGRFSLPKMIHDDLYVEKNMRIDIIYIMYIIYIQYIETRVNVSVSVWVWVCVCGCHVWISRNVILISCIKTNEAMKTLLGNAARCDPINPGPQHG